jgi:DNA-binding transcriptional LysR family regulator
MTPSFRAGSGQLRPWSVREADRTTETMPEAGLIVSDGRTMVDAAIAGLGIAQIIDLVAHPYVVSGELQHLVPGADIDGPPVYALIPLGRRMPPRTRVVLDHLAAVLRIPLRARDS